MEQLNKDILKKIRENIPAMLSGEMKELLNVVIVTGKQDNNYLMINF